MKYYAQFKKRNLNGDLQDALGSDSVFILDGRLNLTHMQNDIATQLYRLRRVQQFDGFTIIKATNFSIHGKLIYSEVLN